jgi:hypothetical protein
MSLCKEITVDISMGPNLRLMLDILNLAVDAIDLSQLQESLRSKLMARAKALEARVEAAIQPMRVWEMGSSDSQTFSTTNGKIDLTPAVEMEDGIVSAPEYRRRRAIETGGDSSAAAQATAIGPAPKPARKGKWEFLGAP